MDTLLRNPLFKPVAFIMVLLFAVQTWLPPASLAQVAFLPAVGDMVNLTRPFDPMLVKGIRFYPDNPFKFDFIVDSGEQAYSLPEIRSQGQKLASYFLASLTTPERDMWVNLSPYEKDRVIPQTFGDTEMGKEVLAEDYMLKQIMATALYPERELGKEFWQKVYAQAARQFGTTDVPVNTFNKVWILPDEAVVYENAGLNSVFVVKSSLKVMLEKDYLAMKNHTQYQPLAANEFSSNLIRQIVLPALTREVNEGSHFAGLRQVYQSLILAAWYKKNLKDNVLAQGYVDRGKTLGIEPQDKQITEKIYRQYLKAYRRGVYNFVKEELDPATHDMIPRKYFSGGFAARVDLAQATQAEALSNAAMLGERAAIGKMLSIRVFAGLALTGAMALFSTSAEAHTVYKHAIVQTFQGHVMPVGATIHPGQVYVVTVMTAKGEIVQKQRYTVKRNDSILGIEERFLGKYQRASTAYKYRVPIRHVAAMASGPGVKTSAAPGPPPTNIFEAIGDSLSGKYVSSSPPPLSFGTPNVQTGRGSIIPSGLDKIVPSKPAPEPASFALGSSEGVLTPMRSGRSGPGIQGAVAVKDYQPSGANTVSVDLSIIRHLEGNGISPAGARGPGQIMPQTLADYNYFHNKKYSLNDLDDLAATENIQKWLIFERFPEILKSRHQEVTLDNILKTYNDGTKWIGQKSLPYETQAYLINYHGYLQDPNYKPISYASLQVVKHKRIVIFQAHPTPRRMALNNAMIGVIPKKQVNGGIDLEKLIFSSQGAGGVRTAFSDPRVLKMLLDARGLFPQVERIETMSVPMVNMLCGLNTLSNPNNHVVMDKSGRA